MTSGLVIITTGGKEKAEYFPSNADAAEAWKLARLDCLKGSSDRVRYFTISEGSGSSVRAPRGLNVPTTKPARKRKESPAVETPPVDVD